MPQRPPARIGQPLAEVDTPALLLDLDAFERNLRRLPSSLPPGAISLRPHAKSHKCPEIARRQLAIGAVGICCQKVSEAEAMIEGGIHDVLISNEIVGATKLARLAALGKKARVAVCVDDAANVDQLEAAAAVARVTLGVLVEINVGSDRCGVAPGEPAVALAKHVAACPHLRFCGLQAYHGPAQHLRPVAERHAAARRAAESARRTKALLEAGGLPCPTVTGGGTGTYACDTAAGIHTELQPGSYLFMDADYARNEWPAGAPRFEQSLFVWSTLMSRPAPDWGAVDAGLKAIATDSGLPLVPDHPGVEFSRAADEHGVLRFHDPACVLAVGDKLRLVPGHCDPTVNLHEWFVGIRRDRVEAVWPITARGAFF
jgi:D-serine deaminase-like pyridoxal phosphate-dependent protein